MTREEKQLLLKDLCERLPYGVKCQTKKGIGTLISVECSFGETIVYVDFGYLQAEEYDLNDGDTVKPYLRPMSSMTEEELNECVYQSGIKDIECPNWQDVPKEKLFEARLNHSIAVFLTDSNNVDWLNSHHFDCRNLIDRGLALEAPENMYKN